MGNSKNDGTTDFGIRYFWWMSVFVDGRHNFPFPVEDPCGKARTMDLLEGQYRTSSSLYLSSSHLFLHNRFTYNTLDLFDSQSALITILPYDEFSPKPRWEINIWTYMRMINRDRWKWTMETVYSLVENQFSTDVFN